MLHKEARCHTVSIAINLLVQFELVVESFFYNLLGRVHVVTDWVEFLQVEQVRDEDG